MSLFKITEPVSEANVQGEETKLQKSWHAKRKMAESDLIKNHEIESGVTLLLPSNKLKKDLEREIGASYESIQSSPHLARYINWLAFDKFQPGKNVSRGGLEIDINPAATQLSLFGDPTAVIPVSEIVILPTTESNSITGIAAGKYRIIYIEAVVISDDMANTFRINYLDDMGNDAFQNMVSTGQVTGRDLVALCNSSNLMKTRCKRSDGLLYRMAIKNELGFTYNGPDPARYYQDMVYAKIELAWLERKPWKWELSPEDYHDMYKDGRIIVSELENLNAPILSAFMKNLFGSPSRMFFYVLDSRRFHEYQDMLMYQIPHHIKFVIINDAELDDFKIPFGTRGTAEDDGKYKIITANHTGPPIKDLIWSVNNYYIMVTFLDVNGDLYHYTTMDNDSNETRRILTGVTSISESNRIINKFTGIIACSTDGQMWKVNEYGRMRIEPFADIRGLKYDLGIYINMDGQIGIEHRLPESYFNLLNGERAMDFILKDTELIVLTENGHIQIVTRLDPDNQGHITRFTQSHASNRIGKYSVNSLSKQLEPIIKLFTYTINVDLKPSVLAQGKSGSIYEYMHDEKTNRPGFLNVDDIVNPKGARILNLSYGGKFPHGRKSIFKLHTI
tara:strand:- start:38276 stop:40132 length:1857 start_codon:yes stop_codon:yes gene_type:complete